MTAGLWPAALVALAAPAVCTLTSAALGLARTWWAITPPLDTEGHLPLAIAALLGAIWAAIVAGIARLTARNR